MIKTQVQIPDHLFREAKRIALEYEMSFADVVRRGLEGVIPSFPPRSGGGETWVLPNLELGLKLDPFADSEWRSALYVTAATVHEARRSRPAKAAKPAKSARSKR